MLQLVGQATAQVVTAPPSDVIPSPPHYVGVAGAAADSLYPLETVVHLVASGHVAQPAAQAVQVLVVAPAAEASKKPSVLQAVQVSVVPETVQVLQPPVVQAVQAGVVPVGAPGLYPSAAHSVHV